jgi:hypothetical protein
MLRFRHALRSGLFAVAATLGRVLTAPVWAATGNVEIAKAGFIVGVGGSSGTLVFKGRRGASSIRLENARGVVLVLRGRISGSNLLPVSAEWESACAEIGRW